MLAANQVDVWRVDLSRQQEGIQRCRQLLSPDEIDRADRFYFEKHRRRFTVARAAMRQILARYVNVAPRDLVFSYGVKGKPELADGPKKSGITFNLSHSSELALLAVANGPPLGVDVELVNPEFATEEIAERFFSASEVNCLRTLPSSERAKGFFSCWTRKEAYIKALGEGLSIPLDSFEVAYGPGVSAALLQVRVNPGEVSRWSMYDLNAGGKYKAAMVVEGKGHRVKFFDF